MARPRLRWPSDAEGLDERLEGARLGEEVVLGGLVPAALGDDQVDGEGAGEGDRGDEPDGREREDAESDAEASRDRRRRGGADEDAGQPDGVGASR